MTTHTPGYMGLTKWDDANDEALFTFGLPAPDSDKYLMTTRSYFTSEADAREVVRRWNAFPDLLAACKALPLGCTFEDAADFKDNARAFLAAVIAAREAVAKAEAAR